MSDISSEIRHREVRILSSASRLSIPDVLIVKHKSLDQQIQTLVGKPSDFEYWIQYNRRRTERELDQLCTWLNDCYDLRQKSFE